MDTLLEFVRATIHENDTLDDIDKFNYLRGLLQCTAIEAISGLAPTSANYQGAVPILEKRFGNKPLTVARHMDALIHADAVSSPHNVKELHRLYEVVESNIRSLASLGVDSGSYGGQLTSVLISKIPAELQLVVTKKLGGDDELQTREREPNAVLVTTAKETFKDPPTAASLLTGGSNKPTCSYCRGDHPSQSCTLWLYSLMQGSSYFRN